MDNINKFYTKLLNALDLDVVDDVVLYNGDAISVKNKTLILYGDKGKQLFQESPNKYHVFNPIDEDRISGVNPELKKLLSIYKIRLNLGIKHSALAILSSLHSAPPLALVPLMDELDKAKGNGKVLVDDKLIGHFVDICNDNELNAININVKHGVFVNGEKENSVVMVNTPIPKLLEDESFIPSLRKKDRRTIVAMFDWLTTYISSADHVVAHSHSDDMPDLIAFFKTLVNVSDKMVPIAKYTKESGSYHDILENDLSISDINNIDTLFLDAKLIPNGNVDVITSPAKQNDDSVKVISTPEELFGSADAFKPLAPQPIYGQPVQPAYGQPTYQQPVQPVYQQPVQPAYGQPMYQQPMQPVYQQPVQPAYGQPVQPMYQQPMQPVYQKPTAHEVMESGGSLFSALKR